jgi:thymidylate synthase
MTLLSTYHANRTWIGLLYTIMEHGAECAPRGKKIKEILGFQTTVDMKYPLVTVEDRKMGYRFAAAEAAWILSGDDRVETIAPFSREITKFSDDGVIFFGAYGPRIKAQMPYIHNCLMDDSDSRQAVINLWRENPPKSKDIPCSISVQWLIRDGKLNCMYTMRSSDAWLGWVYDVFNFTMLSSELLLSLRHGKYRDLVLGDLTLTAGSQHLYERDWSKVESILNQVDPAMRTYPAWRPETLRRDLGYLTDILWNSARSKGALDLLQSASAIEN